MTMQRYDRNSVVGLTMTTVNPCNNFIIDYLIRTKIKSDKQVSSKYYMYNLAIQSVRKYPLPLICEQQLAALEGFGNFFINRVAKLMKRHYLRGRMPTEQEMELDDRDHLQGIRENLKRLNLAKKQKQQQENKEKLDYDRKRNDDSESSQHSNARVYQQKFESGSQSQNQQEDQKNNKKLDPIEEQRLKFQRLMMQNQGPQETKKQKSQKLNKSQKEDKSQKSDNTQKRRRKRGSTGLVRKRINYRPRKNTQPYQVLKAIIKLEKPGNKLVLKGDINQYFYNLKKEKMKGWTPVRERLVQFGYITSSPMNQDQVQLTAKGRQYVYQMQNSRQPQSSDISSKSNSPIKKKKEKKQKDYDSESKSRSRSISKSRSLSDNFSKSDSFSKSASSQRVKKKQKHKQKQKSHKQKSHSKNKRSKTSSHKPKSQKSSRSSRSDRYQRSSHYQKIKYKNENTLKKQPLTVGNLYKDPLIILNEKSELNQKDEERISQLFIQMRDYKYVQEDLQFGDFGWSIDQKLLDIIAIRVKCQNFDNDQFFLTCRRARYSQIQTIYFVFEENMTKNADNKRNLVNSVFADGRAAGFKMIRTTGLAQTLCFIAKITTDLTKKVKSLSQFGQVKPISFIGSYKQFNEHIKIFKPILARNVGISCLRCIPNMSREMIKKIIRKMPGMWYLYKKLKQLRSDSERKRFLFWYLQELHPKKGMIRLIVDLLFFQNYD